MGFYDRDYMRAQPRAARFGLAVPALTITTWLIVINVAVFLLDRLLMSMGWRYVMLVGPAVVGEYGPLGIWGHFSVWTAVQHFQIWRFITFQFLHADFNHLIFNMLALYFFGPIAESYLGRRRFIPFYLLCGVGGAVLYMLLLTVGWRIGESWVPLVGASAGIFGILIAAALVAPNITVMFMMMFPMPLRTVAWLFIAIAIYTVVFMGNNAGGEAGHLGGAAMGWLLMQRPQLLDYLALPKRRRIS